MKPALLIIDMLKDFLHPDGICYGSCEQERWIPVIQNIQSVLNVFRVKKLPIIHIVTSHRNDYSDVEIGELTDLETLAGMDFNRPYLRPCGFVGSKGAEIIEELKPLDNEIVVIKRRYSGFFNTDLDMVLRRKKVDTLLMSGGDADCCVRFTSADAYFRDYNVVLLTDCVESDTKYEYDAAVQNIKKVLGVTRLHTEAIKWINQSSY